MTSVIESKLANVRGNTNLKESVRTLLQAYGEQLEQVKTNPYEVQKIAVEMKNSDSVIDDVVANTQQRTTVIENQENTGVKVLQRDPSGFARVTESVPGMNIFTGQPSPFAPQNQIQASQKLPDSLSDQVPEEHSEVNVEKQLVDQVKSGEKLATSADDVQQPLNQSVNSIQPVAQLRVQSESRVIPTSQAATQPPVNPAAMTPAKAPVTQSVAGK